MSFSLQWQCVACDTYMISRSDIATPLTDSSPFHIGKKASPQRSAHPRELPRTIAQSCTEAILGGALACVAAFYVFCLAFPGSTFVPQSKKKRTNEILLQLLFPRRSRTYAPQVLLRRVARLIVAAKVCLRRTTFSFFFLN